MKVRLISGPNAGRITHLERSSTSQVLVDLGLLEQVTEPLPIPDAPQFGVRKNPFSGKAELFMVYGALVEMYDGNPRLFAGFYGKNKLMPPQSVLATYEALWPAHAGL